MLMLDRKADAMTRIVGPLRSGVPMPDWSFITTDAAERALEGNFAVPGRKEKWANIGEDEDRVWRAILEAFARTGRAPSPSHLAGTTGIATASVSDWLRQLQTRDLVVLDESGAVTAAYPFCTWITGHRVHVGRLTVVNSLCAIDALGMGAMLGRDVTIETACRHCGTPVRITTQYNGIDLETIAPAHAVVWCGIDYATGCAATSGCTVKVFFCSDEHLQAWRSADPAGASGFRLSMEEGLQVGQAMFVPMLRPSKHPAADHRS